MARILLVDDHPETCAAVINCLEQAGHTVVHSSGAWHALGALPAVQPDVVIAEIRMPQMDGFTFLRELREEPRAARVPVIILTCVRDEDLRWRASDMGIERVFLKGEYELAELLKCVDGLVEDEAAAVPTPVLQYLIPSTSLAGNAPDELPA
jgi:DNA-binding response OmpR family regulator